MFKTITATSAGVLCLAATSALCFLDAPAQEPKGPDKKRDDKLALILGSWESQDRHLAMGTLYQPSHTTRQRKGSVHFKLDGDKLTGYSITPPGNGLSGSASWKDGRTEFRTVTFADGKLTIEFDVKEINHGYDLSVKEKAIIRIEARLVDGRLLGKWGLFLKDGSEPFRGEWEAVRPKDKKPEEK
jgi:hypothetical protein